MAGCVRHFHCLEQRLAYQLVSFGHVPSNVYAVDAFHFCSLDRRFISLGLYGLINMAIARRYFPVAGLLFVLQYVVYGIYVHFKGVPSPISLALGIARTPDLAHLFVLSLVAGSLSFGGAYVAIPFVHAEAVLRGRWMPEQVFIDC